MSQQNMLFSKYFLLPSMTCFSAFHVSLAISIKKKTCHNKTCFSADFVLLSISCKFHHFRQKKIDMSLSHFQQILCFSAFHESFAISIKQLDHVTTKHAFQQILCFSAFYVSFAISIKKRHVTTKHAFQQILCFSAFHVSFTISIKKIALSQQFILAP